MHTIIRIKGTMDKLNPEILAKMGYIFIFVFSIVGSRLQSSLIH